MSNIFLPLRSNAAWFASQSYRAVLEYRLKNLAMIYDVLVVQNGRYHRAVSETGAFEFLKPAGQIEDRTKLRFISPGTPFSVSVSETGSGDWHPLIGGAALVNYDVDFFPIFHDAGLADAPYIDWREIDITEQGKSQAKMSAAVEKRRPEVRSLLPQGRFLQDGIIDGLYIDSILAADQAIPLSVDYHAGPLIQSSNARIAGSLSPDVRATFQNMWINLGLPDVGALSWEEVDRIRESDAGRDYRELVGRLTERAVADLGQGAAQSDIEHELKRGLVNELVQEIGRSHTTLRKALFNVGLNLIPYSGLATTAADLAAVLEERRSWIALLGLSI